ncbi:exostosin family protein [Striga asiatica]|uniref:Exostosin family protein n=1 Tax=Striga asiatica TaxID=4170 RepID=A0A5A7PX53_STRAF|nr:exostosin family protein [Striga asiatica]
MGECLRLIAQPASHLAAGGKRAPIGIDLCRIDVLRWDSFSIKVNVSDIPRLKEILLAVTEGEYLRPETGWTMCEIGDDIFLLKSQGNFFLGAQCPPGPLQLCHCGRLLGINILTLKEKVQIVVGHKKIILINHENQGRTLTTWSS